MSKNLTLIQKAQTSLGELQDGGGDLAEDVSREFIQQMIIESVIMKEAQVIPMRSHTQRIPLVGLSRRILKAGTGGTPIPREDATQLDWSKQTLNAKLFRGVVSVEEEVLEDNIEQGRFKNTLLDLIAGATARDMDEIIINGDTTSADPFLASFDGILRQATIWGVDFDSERLAIADATDPDAFLHLSQMQRMLPKQYKRDLGKMKLYTSFNAVDDYQNALLARQTVLGDSNVVNAGSMRFKGVPIVPVGMFPNDDDDETQALLINPKNIKVGIWRNIRVRVKEHPEDGIVNFIVDLRADCRIAEPDACVRGYAILNT